VKFFLCTASGPMARATDFIGPDRAETLAGKLQALFGRQLQYMPPAPWSAYCWQPAAFVRGWLFYAHDRPAPAMPGLNPGHLRGRWIARERLDELQDGAWQLLPRAQWMVPAHQGHGAVEPVELRRLGEQLDAQWKRLASRPGGLQRRALLVARLAHGSEAERVFVMPADQ
jgi:hypothetical protein